LKLRCPICGGTVEVPDDAMSGELVEHDCGVVLEVVRSGDGVSLKPFEGVEEDWGE
jgi:alpha-aminoadipate carrier protein LysW